MWHGAEMDPFQRILAAMRWFYNECEVAGIGGDAGQAAPRENF